MHLNIFFFIQYFLFYTIFSVGLYYILLIYISIFKELPANINNFMDSGGKWPLLGFVYFIPLIHLFFCYLAYLLKEREKHRAFDLAFYFYLGLILIVSMVVNVVLLQNFYF